ncbi:ATP-binding protein [Ruminococcus sp. 5_1_39BFAA]|uniref:ATP-binding protein n=1 Tax=Ruminococcus sp. 5_1_39BFAA TaxID=457412 RepID=UPI003567330C
MEWMTGLSSFSYCMEMMISALIFMVYLEKRKGFWLRMLCSIVVLFLCAVFVNPFFQEITRWYNWLWFFIVYAVVILLCYLCCNISFYDAIYCASLGYLLQHIASSLYILLTFQGSMPAWSGVLYYMSYAVVYTAVFFIFAKKLQENGHYDVSGANAMVTGTLVLGIVLCLSVLVKGTTMEVTGAESATEKYEKLFCLTQLYAISICTIFLVVQLLQRNELRAVRRLNQNQSMWEQRQLQYELSKENIDLINRKCHDMKHQIAALAQAEKTSSSRQTFVRDVQNMIEVYDSDASTGNEALDTILMEKGLYCRLHDIEWTCVADGKLLSFMDVVDLYTIMGNVLDNAVEGVEKCVHGEWKTIGVRIWQRGLFAVIQVENTYAEQIEFVNGLPKTSKEDKGSHGFGVRSIKAMAEKYGGSIHIKAEDGIFTLTILIPLP